MQPPISPLSKTRRDMFQMAKSKAEDPTLKVKWDPSHNSQLQIQSCSLSHAHIIVWARNVVFSNQVTVTLVLTAKITISIQCNILA